MAAMPANRRKHPRVHARALSAHLRSLEGRRRCLVENVSLGGIFVRTDQLEEVGTELFVDLLRPGWKKMLTVLARTTSRVDVIDGRASRRTPGMGLQFVRLDEKQHERMRALLTELGARDDEADLTIAIDDGPTLGDEAEAELRALGSSEPPVPLPAGGQPLSQQVHLVSEAIEGELKDAYLPPPAPLAVEEARVPRLRRDPSRLTAEESERLQTQLRGLSMQLSDAQQQLALREGEIERLREELELTREALRRAQRGR
jgi:Tfp pilus assembly protein PilZ